MRLRVTRHYYECSTSKVCLASGIESSPSLRVALSRYPSTTRFARLVVASRASGEAQLHSYSLHLGPLREKALLRAIARLTKVSASI